MTTRKAAPAETERPSADEAIPEHGSEADHDGLDDVLARALTGTYPPRLDPEFVEQVGKQLRRRREAALRLPPLASGRRDPMDSGASDGRWP